MSLRDKIKYQIEWHLLWQQTFHTKHELLFINIKQINVIFK